MTPLALSGLVAALVGLGIILMVELSRRMLARRRLFARIHALRSGLRRSEPGKTTESLRRRDRRGLGVDLARWLPDVRQFERRLARAGLTLGPGDALLVGVLAGTALAGLAWWASNSVLAALAGFPLGAVLLPLALLDLLRRRRERAFVRLLPEALDLVVRAVKSGLPVVEAIALIGEEVEEPVGGLFREVASAVRVGTPLEEALWEAVDRMDVPELRFFVIALSIQRETGGNLAEIVENLSSLVRRREQMKMKIRAMSSEARASALIIGALPFVMTAVIYTINPDYIMRLFSDPRGWAMVAGGLTSMGLGMLVIARMVRFEI